MYLCNLFFAIVVFSSAVETAGQETIVTAADVDYCELLQNPAEFDGKRVTIKATFRYGFEWQEIFCLSCRDLAKTWLEIDDDTISASARKALKKFPKNEGTVTADFSGTFESSKGPYGDGSYRFRFILEDIRQPEVVSKSGFDPSHLPRNVKCKVCGSDAQ